MRPGKAQPKGFTLVEVLIALAVAVTVMAMAVVAIVPAGRAAKEATAVANMRAIAQAEAAALAAGSIGYVPLSRLGPGPSGMGLLDEKLATGNKQGYTFTVILAGNTNARSGDQPPDTPSWCYFIQAVPRIPGYKSYRLDSDGNVLVNPNGDDKLEPRCDKAPASGSKKR